MVVESLDAKGKVAAFGSGVVIAPGQVITNRHVIEDGVSFRIEHDGKKWPAKLVRVDPDHDLAELSVAGLDAPVVTVRDSSKLAVGEKVYAIGAPEGLELTISEGLISGLRDFGGARVIQTSAAISPGSSGGGLFDAQGRLVGITTFYLKEGQSLNFALPVGLIAGLAGDGTLTDGELTGTYSGVVHNLTVGLRADFVVVLRDKRGEVRGCAAVMLPLFGSGPLRGTAHGSKVSFDVQSVFFLLQFRGQRYPSHTGGTYLARPIVGAAQVGTFTLHRRSLAGLPSGFDIRNCPGDDEVHAE